LGYLMPMVLGGIASRFAGKPANAQALTNMFADQKTAIANALPSGFSLPDVPGLGAAGSAARGALDATPASGSSLMQWPLALAAVVALAFILWYYLRPGQTPTSDVAKVSTDVTSNIKSLTDTLSGIKDEASADAALPKLTELGGKLGGMKEMVDKLPTAEKS